MSLLIFLFSVQPFFTVLAASSYFWRLFAIMALALRTMLNVACCGARVGLNLQKFVIRWIQEALFMEIVVKCLILKLIMRVLLHVAHGNVQVVKNWFYTVLANFYCRYIYLECMNCRFRFIETLTAGCYNVCIKMNEQSLEIVQLSLPVMFSFQTALVEMVSPFAGMLLLIWELKNLTLGSCHLVSLKSVQFRVGTV